VSSRQRTNTKDKDQQHIFINGIIYRNSYEKEEENREMCLTKQMKGCGRKANEVDGSESELESRNRERNDFDLKDCSK
jgi:hypothetical protein